MDGLKNDMVVCGRCWSGVVKKKMRFLLFDWVRREGIADFPKPKHVTMLDITRDDIYHSEDKLIEKKLFKC